MLVSARVQSWTSSGCHTPNAMLATPAWQLPSQSFNPGPLSLPQRSVGAYLVRSRGSTEVALGIDGPACLDFSVFLLLCGMCWAQGNLGGLWVPGQPEMLPCFPLGGIIGLSLRQGSL